MFLKLFRRREYLKKGGHQEAVPMERALKLKCLFHLQMAFGLTLESSNKTTASTSQKGIWVNGLVVVSAEA